MTQAQAKVTIYGSLLLLCSLASPWLGLEAAIWTFLQILIVIELTVALGRWVEHPGLHG